jgi:hypothetical protein
MLERFLGANVGYIWALGEVVNLGIMADCITDLGRSFLMGPYTELNVSYSTIMLKNKEWNTVSLSVL